MADLLFIACSQLTPYIYNGCNLDMDGFVTTYPWHIPDPIIWLKECRITIQQIGWMAGLYKRQDDWSCAAFWYKPLPSAGFAGCGGPKQGHLAP